MEIMQRLECGELNCNVDFVVVNGINWFRGKDISIALGYSDTKRALQLHVACEDKCKLEVLRGDSNLHIDLTKQFNNKPASIILY